MLIIVLGDSCRTPEGVVGICKFLTECLPAIDTLKQGVIPQICGFVGTQSIVCCVGAGPWVPPSSSTTTTIKTTATTKSTRKTTTEKPTLSKKVGDITKKSKLSQIFSIPINNQFSTIQNNCSYFFSIPKRINEISEWIDIDIIDNQYFLEV